jgi:hypothetical protein
MLLAPRVAALRLGNGGSDVAISASQTLEGILVPRLLRWRGRSFGNRTAREERRSAGADRSLACTVLWVIDHAPKPRDTDGKLPEFS